MKLYHNSIKSKGYRETYSFPYHVTVPIDQEQTEESQSSNDLGQDTQPSNDPGRTAQLPSSNDLGQNTQPSNDPGRTAQLPSSNSPGQTTDKGKKLYSISYQLYIHQSPYRSTHHTYT